MAQVIALQVHFVQIKNNFIHLHSNMLRKFKSVRNAVICVEVASNDRRSYCSCSSTPVNFNGENALNICSSFAETLNLKEFDAVIISAAEHLAILETVYVTPVHDDDWKIVENCAETIQSTLLNQIRVVSVHQIVTIWISKSCSVRVHVDEVDGERNSGILELYSKVIVSSSPRICDKCSQHLSVKNIDASQNVWSFFKDIFYSVTKTEDPSPVVEMNRNFLNYEFIGVFRCLPYKTSVLNFPSKLYNFPFNAFVGRIHSKKMHLEFPNGNLLCRLTSIPYVSSKQSKDLKKVDSTEPIQILTGQSSSQVFVYLRVIDDDCVADDSTFDMLTCHPSLFVSNTVQRCLNLKVNSKIKLDVLLNSKGENQITEINYNVLNFRDSDNQDDIEVEIKNELSSYAKLYGKLVLNNYTVFPLFSTPHVLFISFNPANQPFIELDLEDINVCNFRSILRDNDFKWNDDIEKNVDLYVVSLNFYQNIIWNLKIQILLNLRLMRSNTSFDVEANNFTLLEGDAGSGKTTIVDIICEEFPVSSFSIFAKKISCKTLKGKMVPKLRNLLVDVLVECVHHQPAVLFLDDLDILFSSSKESHQERSDSGISYILRLSHMISDLIRSFSKYCVAILVTAKNVSCFENIIYGSRGKALFSSSLRIPPLDQAMREECFRQFLLHRSTVVVPESIFEKNNIHNYVERMNGYCVQDISDFVDRICFEAAKRQLSSGRTFQKPQVCETDIENAISAITPVSLKGIDFYKNSVISWKDVGGLYDAKQHLMEILIWPARYPKIFEQCPLKMQSGVLLFGAPGTGKTLLASAVAGESGLNFISIKGPELLSKFVGASEEGIRNTYRKAQNARPCILFFDEFDSLAPRRGNDITGATDRVVNQLLTALDGVEAVSGVWTLASTSRPDLIDPALLRPGRLGTLIHCPLPNQDERLSILTVMSATMNLSDNIDWNSIAEITDGYTGADLRALLYSAFINADKTCKLEMKLNSKNRNELESAKNHPYPLVKIDTQSLLKAAREMKPSLKLQERQQYEKIYKRFIRSEENYEAKLDEQRLTYA